VLGTAETAQRVAQQTARFDDLFRRYYPSLFGLAYRLFGDLGESEENVQETFLRLARSRVAVQSDAEVGAWLRRVCLNLGFNRLRDRRRAVEHLERAARLQAGGTDAAQADPARAVLRREEQANVRAVLLELPDRQRACLLLRHSGYSYSEIAATLGIALGSVGVLLSRAERAFREIYLEREHELS
jgi:RNA polymerase sigma-70 factor (ECF subfamily)